MTSVKSLQNYYLRTGHNVTFSRQAWRWRKWLGFYPCDGPQWKTECLFFCVVPVLHISTNKYSLDLLAIYSIRGIHSHRQISTFTTKSSIPQLPQNQNKIARPGARGKTIKHVRGLNPSHQPHLLFLILLLLRLSHLAKLSAYQNQGLGDFSKICRRIVQFVEKI